MPKPYRRRKGKTGPYVGNYRCTVDGRDINLQTKDPSEALARARLAGKGKWPPIDAAVAAARATLDPAGKHNTDPEPPPDAGASVVADAEGPHTDKPPPVTHPSASRESISHDEPEPLNAAATAAAAESSGKTGVDPDRQAEQENHVNSELASVMAELSGGASGGDLLDGLADGVAAFILWGEAKGLELGVNWTLARRKSTMRLRTKQLEQGHLMRKALRVGLKGAAITWFPDFATSLTPGWAIAIGMIGGASVSLMQGEMVDAKTGQVTSVGEAVTQAQEAAQQQPPPTPPPAAA